MHNKLQTTPTLDLKASLKKPLKVAFAIGLVTALITLFIPNYYRSEARLLPVGSGISSNLDTLPTAAANFGVNVGGAGRNDTNYMDILKSRWFKGNLLTTRFTFHSRGWRFGVERLCQETLYDYLGETNMDRAVQRLDGIYHAELDIDTNVITMYAESKSPELSQAILHTASDLLNRFMVSNRRTRGSEKAAFATARLAVARQERDKAEEASVAFLEANRNFQRCADPVVWLKGTRLTAELELRRQLVTALVISHDRAVLEAKNDIPILNVLDAGNLPMEKTRPFRGLIVLLMLGLSGTGAWAWECRRWLRVRVFGTEGPDARRADLVLLMPTQNQFRLCPSLLSWAGILLVFIYGLNIPRVSGLSMIGLFAIAAHQSHGGLRLRLSDAFTVGVLLLFLVCFFIPSVIYGFSEPFADLRDGMILACCYGAGLFWARLQPPGAPGIRMPFAMAAGFTVFSALTAFANPYKAETFLSADRSAPHFWAGGAPMNGPVLGIFASLGLCMLPLVFLRSRDPRSPSGPGWPSAALALAGLGFASNLIMQNRSPYVALAGSILVCSTVFLQRQEGGAVKRVWSLFFRLLPVVGLFLVLTILFPDFTLDILTKRFENEGLDTGGRTAAWVSVIQGLPAYPFGGKRILIGGLQYAHNLWMDVAYNSGLIAMLALLAFHLAHLPFLARFYRSRPEMTETLVVSGLGVSMLMGCIGEPTLDASMLYFGSTCFLLGWVKTRAESAAFSPTRSNTRSW